MTTAPGGSRRRVWVEAAATAWAREVWLWEALAQRSGRSSVSRAARPRGDRCGRRLALHAGERALPASSGRGGPESRSLRRAELADGRAPHRTGMHGPLRPVPGGRPREWAWGAARRQRLWAQGTAGPAQEPVGQLGAPAREGPGTAPPLPPGGVSWRVWVLLGLRAVPHLFSARCDWLCLEGSEAWGAAAALARQTLGPWHWHCPRTATPKPARTAPAPMLGSRAGPPGAHRAIAVPADRRGPEQRAPGLEAQLCALRRGAVSAPLWGGRELRLGPVADKWRRPRCPGLLSCAHVLARDPVSGRGGEGAARCWGRVWRHPEGHHGRGHWQGVTG